MADALKAEGNAAFANQNWDKAIDCWTKAIKKEKDDVALASLYSNRSAAHLKISKYDAALRDAEEAVLKRPTWSKAKARMAEVYARQQIFDLATASYERAIELAEDDATRERYQASLATTKDAEEKAERKNTAPQGAIRRPIEEMQERFFVNRVVRAMENGTYSMRPGGGMSFSYHSKQTLAMGMKDLQQNIRKIPGTDQMKVYPFSHAIAFICECLIMDDTTFMIEYGDEPGFSIPDKIDKLIKTELSEGGCEKYFTHAIWAPKDMIADLNRRIATEGRQHIRQATSALIRGRIVSAGVLRFNPLGVASATLILATRDMQTAAAKRAYKLEDVEEIAQRVVREHPPDQWDPCDGTSIMRVAYSAYPVWESYMALGYVEGIGAGRPLLDIKPRKYRFADLDAAKKAAEAYDKAAAILADEAPDFHRRCFVLWYAIHWRLRAGGLSVRELRSRINAAKEATAETKRFVLDIEDSFKDIRALCETQLKSINESMRQAPPGITDRSTIKPVPTLNCTGLPRSFPAGSLIDQAEFARLPGEIGCIDQRG